MSIHNTQAGFTLVEVLVTTAIVGIIMTGVYNLFNVHNRMAARQEETTLMQQELLSVMEQISDELRMCGYSKTGMADLGFKNRDTANDPDYNRATNSTSIYCILDGNNNGGLDENGTNSSADHVGYGLNINGAGNPSVAAEHFNVVKKYYTGAVRWQPAATNIGDLRFTYFDVNGAPIANPSANLNDIRSVEINATAVPSPERAGLGIANRTMSTRIWCRNQGPQVIP